MAITTHASIWKVTPVGRVPQGYTDHDRNIFYDGLLYESAVGYVPSAIKTGVKLAPGNLDLSGIISTDGISSSDLLAGVYDYADVLISVIDWQDVAGGIIRNRLQGKLGKVQVLENMFHVELSSITAMLSQNIGRIISPSCDVKVFGDSRCGYPLTTDPLTVDGVTDNRRFTDSTNISPDDHYNYGSVTWTSGTNVGLKFDIKDFVTGGSFELFETTPYGILPGDTGTVSIGCNRTFTDCQKYGRVPSFRGFPYVPGTHKLFRPINQGS